MYFSTQSRVCLLESLFLCLKEIYVLLGQVHWFYHDEWLFERLSSMLPLRWTSFRLSRNGYFLLFVLALMSLSPGNPASFVTLQKGETFNKTKRRSVWGSRWSLDWFSWKGKLTKYSDSSVIPREICIGAVLWLKFWTNLIYLNFLGKVQRVEESSSVLLCRKQCNWLKVPHTWVASLAKVFAEPSLPFLIIIS